MKALAYEPEQRFPDMKTFGAVLAQFTEGGQPVVIAAAARRAGRIRGAPLLRPPMMDSSPAGCSPAKTKSAALP